MGRYILLFLSYNIPFSVWYICTRFNINIVKIYVLYTHVYIYELPYIAHHNHIHTISRKYLSNRERKTREEGHTCYKVVNIPGYFLDPNKIHMNKRNKFVYVCNKICRRNKCFFSLMWQFCKHIKTKYFIA